MFEFNYERELESYLVENADKYFPFKIIGRQYKIAKGCRVDLLGADDNNTYIIEIKKASINKKSLERVQRYLANYQIRKKRVIGVLVGTRITKPFAKELDQMENIKYIQIKDVFLRKPPY